MTALPKKVLKAVGLQAVDTMRLKAVDLVFDPEQNLYVIAGDNAQGKSTVLNVIAMLLGGRRLDPPRVVRDGADEAHAELPLDDGHVVRGVWKTGQPGRIEVVAPNGTPLKAPQAWLNERVGRYSFDPVAWLALKESDQRDEMMKGLGLDFAALDKDREERFAERTIVNREADRFKARLSALPKPGPDALEPVDLQSLVSEKNRIGALQQEKAALTASAREAAMKRDGLVQQHRTIAAAIEGFKGTIADYREAIAKIEQQQANAEAQLKGIEERGKAAAEESRKAQLLAEQAPDMDLEMADVDMKLSDAEAHGEAARKAKEREQLSADLKKKEEEADALGKRITAIDSEKDAMLAKAKFPVDGLGFTASGLKMNGLAFSQASQAERLRVAVALGLISKPELRILLVREGSLLDDKSMGLLAAVAAEYDAQVVVECVGRNRAGPCIVIEDGLVAEVRA